jgi:outer membrane protein TolC
VNSTRLAALLISGLTLIAVPVHAQNIDVPALPTSIPGAPDTSGDNLPLNLAAAFELALTRNLDLQVGRYDIAAADANILTNTGIFDLGLAFGVSGDATVSPSATLLEGALVTESRNTRFNFGLEQLLPSGTLLQMEAKQTRSETNSEFFFLNPRWNAQLGFQLTQPLLKGFGTTVNRAGIVIARNARAQNAEFFEMMVVNTLQQVENTYWDLVAARRAEEVSGQSLELAERLLGETRERVKVGTSAPIDLVQSEAGVATRLENVISARNIAFNAEDSLKAVLGFDQPGEWMTSIETLEGYEFQPLEPDLREAIDTALEQRPEIRRKQLELEQLEYRVDVARNATLPNLNLDASYGWGGIDGDIVSPPHDGGPGGAWEQVRGTDFPGWSLGARFTMPIGNNEAQGRLAERRFAYQKSNVELAALKQKVIRDVRFAVRALEDGAAAVEAALASRELAERNLDAEQTKFANGMSTNYQVLEIQEDQAQAQLRLIRAYLDYRRAMVGYRVSTGTLLGVLGVDIVDAGSPDVPHDYWANVKWLQVTDHKKSAGLVTHPAPPASEK